MRTALAMLLAVVLGAGGGVAVGLAGDAGRPVGVATESDPLHLGVSQRDLPCDDGNIRIVAAGDTARDLRLGVIDAADEGDDPHYLRIDDSCRTIYVRADQVEKPEYVAYVGPYAFDVDEPCEVRMSDGHINDYVTHLVDGNDTFVKCPCVLPPSAAPVLDRDRPETVLGTGNIWLRALQNMLVDVGKLPADHRAGRFDDETEAAVRLIQQRNAIEQSGVVGFRTWRAVRVNICSTYDF